MDITTKEIKKEIIQATGLKAREISVRERSGGMDWSILIEVKKEYPLSKIESIVNKYTKSDRCERTYEILTGGNTHITVQYQWEMKLSDELTQTITTVLEQAEKEIQEANESFKARDMSATLDFYDMNKIRCRHLANHIECDYTKDDFIYILKQYQRHN